MPDGCGLDFFRMVRNESEVPIIFLTASDEEMNIIMGLDMAQLLQMKKVCKLAYKK